ncbi:MAG: hypothetical protein IJR52_10445, partial [Selenomonadaceae bacterium]|nr:hypothetical protein [Selenomonadaceae bacterium]
MTGFKSSSVSTPTKRHENFLPTKIFSARRDGGSCPPSKFLSAVNFVDEFQILFGVDAHEAA